MITPICPISPIKAPPLPYQNQYGKPNKYRYLTYQPYQIYQYNNSMECKAYTHLRDTEYAKLIGLIGQIGHRTEYIMLTPMAC